MTKPVYFVHISDSHLGSDPEFEYKSRHPYPNATKLVAAIRALPISPDFVMHTGDVANGRRSTLGAPPAYRLAEEIFGTLDLPIYYAVGNHDDPAEILKLRMGEKTSVMEADEPIVSYAFQVEDERFVVIHSQGPHEEVGGGGRLPEGQLAYLEDQLTDGVRTTIFIHHCPLDLDSEWFRDRVDMADGIELHRMLISHRDTVRAVFFGHIHRGVQIIRDGIHYCSVGSPFMGLNYWPEVDETDVDLALPLPYNLVTLTGDATIVKEHSVPHTEAE